MAGCFNTKVEGYDFLNLVVPQVPEVDIVHALIREHRIGVRELGNHGFLYGTPSWLAFCLVKRSHLKLRWLLAAHCGSWSRGTRSKGAAWCLLSYFGLRLVC